MEEKQIEELQHLYKNFTESDGLKKIEDYNKLNEVLYPLLPELLGLVKEFLSLNPSDKI